MEKFDPTIKDPVVVFSSGHLYFNGKNAATRYGISLQDGAVSNLLTPAANKAYVTNESRLLHGTQIHVGTPKMQARDIALPFNLIAKDKTDFYTKYDLFCQEVLSAGAFTLSTPYIPKRTFRLVYNSCTQFSEFRFSIGKFSLKVTEPDPSNREYIATEDDNKFDAEIE